MFTYRQVKAIQEHRYGVEKDDLHRNRRPRRHRPLPELLGAVASGLASLGMKEGRGKTRPSSPAY